MFGLDPENKRKSSNTGKVVPHHGQLSRLQLLKYTALGLTSLALPAREARAFDWNSFFRSHFTEMSKEEIKEMLARLEAAYLKTYNKKITVSATEPLPDVSFGYGLDLSRCIGCRRCVYACVGENNQSRNPQIHWITVLRLKKGEKFVSDLEKAEKYYNPEKVPEEGYFYMPVQCQHCQNPPCVKACPIRATWKEPDGIVVIDYDWCMGCRMCMAACPYGARHLNWTHPQIPSQEVNPHTHYLGNRPRQKGCVEKCTFCIQRTREGQYPACVEICPVGARKFGNLLDPKSEIRYCIDQKRVFRLKEALNTKPRFFYFFAT